MLQILRNQDNFVAVDKSLRTHNANSIMYYM